MGKILIDKNTFVRSIEDVHRTLNYIDEFNDFLDDYGAEGYVFPPTCVDSTVELLSLVVGDTDDWVGYFCYELDFGKNWKEGCIHDEDGNNVKLTSPEELYDFLLSGQG